MRQIREKLTDRWNRAGRGVFQNPVDLKLLRFACIFISWYMLLAEVPLSAQTMGKIKDISKNELATFGAGCFWCVEAIYTRVEGVSDVRSGFSGGQVKNPSYKEVCTGSTGHAEVCQITFDPDVISFLELLEIFWKIHDPTTLNRQGNDLGTQYRSVIFYHTEEQKKVAEEMKQRLNQEGIWKDPVVTEIVPFVAFYQAEEYHDDYFEKNPNQPYCSVVIAPKVEKFEKIFKEFIKPDNSQ